MKFLRLTLFLTSAVLNSVYAEVKYFSKCIHEKDFAITFDDGPSLDYTSKVLDVLDEFHVKATFFINGNNCVNILENKTARELIKREYNSGHVIGSHTYSHPSGITTLSDDELTYEMETLNNAIFEIIGVKPNFFRPPLGEYNEDNLVVLEKCGIKANILWNLDSEDWNPEYNATQQYLDNLEGKDPFTHSFISLNHDIQKVTAEKNLRIVIPYIKSLGYNIVTMDVCTGIPAYQGQDRIKEKENEEKGKKEKEREKEEKGKEEKETEENNNNNSGNNSNIVVGENKQNLNNSNDATTLKISFIFNAIILTIISFLII